MTKRQMTCIISSIALVEALVASQQAHAQEAAPPESARPASESPASATAPGVPKSSAALEEIVVTAQKVAENLQSVPVAVTAFTGEALRQQAAKNVLDVANLTPGLIIRNTTISGAVPLIQIRGQVQREVISTVDPSVGIYVDGYYWARAAGLNADLLDIQSIETLRGPQGTLFGRNTTGGAILIKSNDPDFRGLHGSVSATYGRFNQADGTVVLNVPIIADKLAVRGAFQRSYRDGYVENPVDHRKADNRDSWIGRAKILWRPTDNLTIVASGEWFKTDFRTNFFRTIYMSPTSPAALEAAVQAGLGTAASCTATPAARAACTAQGSALYQATFARQAGTDTIAPAPSFTPVSVAKTRTYTGTATLDTSFGAIKAIGGYRKVDSQGLLLYGQPFDIISGNNLSTMDQYSVEVQATGKLFDDRLSFAAGVFYFKESGVDTQYIVQTPAQNKSITEFIGDIDNDSKGVYGQATWNFTDKLSVTGGLRYSVENKGLESRNGLVSVGNINGRLPGATFTCFYPVCPAGRSDKFTGLSYLAGIDYKITPDIFVYAKTAKGFRSGGQNLRAVNVITLVPFKPEQATSYEGGVKSEFFDKRLRVNVGAYYTKVIDIQRTTAIFDSGRVFSFLGNAGRDDIYGGEVEVSALLGNGFRVDTSAAYTYPKYKDYFDRVTGFDRRREPQPLVPRWTWTVSPSYVYDFGTGHVTLRGDILYTSKMTLQNIGTFTDAAGVIRDATSGAVMSAADAAGLQQAIVADAATIVNARASVTLMEDRLELEVFGKNLTDNRGAIAGQWINGFNFGMTIPHEPRTFGASVRYKFGAN